jgi:hypothetical protein
MSAFNLSKQQIEKAIADVVYRDWQPNGSRAEGYSIMVAKEGEKFFLDNIKVERLRLRLNTIDRLFNPDHKPLVLWTVKSYQGGVELRYIYGDESGYNYKEREHVRLYDDSDGKPHDGVMSFSAYLFYVAYTAGIGHSKEDNAYEKKGKEAVVDLANDFVYDSVNSQYIFDGQQLYDHIWNLACNEAQVALNQAVEDYLGYCSENGLIYEAIHTER